MPISARAAVKQRAKPTAPVKPVRVWAPPNAEDHGAHPAIMPNRTGPEGRKWLVDEIVSV